MHLHNLFLQKIPGNIPGIYPIPKFAIFPLKYSIINFFNIFLHRNNPMHVHNLFYKKIPGNIPGIYAIPKSVNLALKYSIINFFKKFLHQNNPMHVHNPLIKKNPGITSGFYAIPKRVNSDIFKRLFILLMIAQFHINLLLQWKNRQIIIDFGLYPEDSQDNKLFQMMLIS